MSKKIKIFALPSHQTDERTSGVDFVRVIQPMKELGKQKEFKVTVWTPDMKIEWPEVAKKYDVIYFGYLNNPWGYATMGAMARKYDCKLIMDIDDNLWGILQDNVVYDTFKKGSQGINVITSIVKDVDYVTCTNDYLKNVLVHNTDKPHNKIKVFPNYIDLNLYSHKAKEKDTVNVNIGHFGSTTHFANIQNPEFIKALTRIMEEYPNVTFTTIGSFFGEFKMKWGQRYIQKFGDVDIYKWIKEKYPPFADDIDFFVTPLEVNVYNQCKSATKFNEISSTARPGVWQNIRQYREVVSNGVNGYLCTHADEWYKAMKELVESTNLRKQMGEEAYKTVKENYTIQGNIKAYADFFSEMILDK